MRMMHSDEYYRDDQAVIHHEDGAGLLSQKKNPLTEFAKAMRSSSGGGLGKRPHQEEEVKGGIKLSSGHS